MLSESRSEFLYRSSICVCTRDISNAPVRRTDVNGAERFALPGLPTL